MIDDDALLAAVRKATYNGWTATGEVAAVLRRPYPAVEAALTDAFRRGLLIRHRGGWALP